MNDIMLSHKLLFWAISCTWSDKNADKMFIWNGPSASLAKRSWDSGRGGRVRSSAAAGIRLRPDIPPLTRTTLPRVQISCLFSAFVLLGYSERLSVHRVGESTCHLPLGKQPQSCEPHPRSHRNVAGVKRVRFGHRPPSEPCPCMVKQIISPSPDLNDLSLSRHCHSHWSPDPRRDLASAGEKIPMSKKEFSPPQPSHPSSNGGSTLKIYHVFHFPHPNGAWLHPMRRQLLGRRMDAKPA